VVKGLLSICKALGSISTTSKKTKQKKKQPDLKFILSKTKVIMFYSVVFQVMLANKQYWKPPYQMISGWVVPCPAPGECLEPPVPLSSCLYGELNSKP
jgi:hypothetical protein